MKNFVVSTDSTCDLYAREIKEKDIYFVPLTYTLIEGDKITECLDEFKKYSEYVAYYDKMRNGVDSKTSMLNLYSHVDHFTKMAKDGVKKAIHFTISYGLSPTIDVAHQALEIVRETYPDFECLCVECSTTTVGQGAMVNIAVDMRDKGKTLQETYDYIQSVKLNMQHFIIVDSLKHLQKGGRISATSATVGTILKVKPVLIFNKQGKLQKYKQSSGLKHTVSMVVKEFENYTLNKDYPIVYVAHTDNLPMAEYMQSLLKENYKLNAEIRIIGPIIGTHLGPNAVALAFLSNQERPM